MRQTLLWTAAALLGIVATAVVAWSASQLTGQRIGLGSEPLSAVTQLVPNVQAPSASERPVAQGPARSRARAAPTTGSHSTTTSAPASSGSSGVPAPIALPS